ncbi:MAG: FG-GAP-like repeat-containing protein [Bacteroidota bacterium]|nr:FG-GAP-like repeat-containing protein [Bacteroidota bacterium]
MKKQIFVFMMVLVTILSSTSFKFDNKNLKEELEQLKQHGITYRFIDENTIELEQEWSGFKRTKTLAQPTEADIKAYIQKHDIPLLEIDPAIIDTSQYAGWYNYWATVPVSNNFGDPLQVGDIDNNGKAEVYGIYRQYYSWDWESHIYEVDTNGKVTFLYQYIPRRGASMQFIDVDKNGLKEVVFRFGDSSFFYEQSAPNELPINRKFTHAKYEYPGTAIGTKETVINMDNDSLIDFLYRGTEWDSTHTYSILKTYVAEYDPIINNFKKIWSINLLPVESGLGGYDVGDYDSDGKMDFLATGIWGQVWVVENEADNDYGLIWKDSIPFVNLFYQTSGDVDNDGKREFFVGATMSNGNWTIMYEADSNNSYSPKFAFHLFSGGSLDEPTYMTVDIDNDNKLELVILSGADLYFFKSNEDNAYYLWYYKRFNAKESIQFYDFNSDGKKDYILSYSLNKDGRIVLFADIYKATGISGIKNENDMIPSQINLYQNYPNPFNPTTVINYSLPPPDGRAGIDNWVSLKVYDVLGREVATLVDEFKEAGYYEVEFDASSLSSGVYIYKLVAGNYTTLKKMILLR